MTRPRALAERLWSRVDKNGPVPAHCPERGPCWIWTGARSKPRGYGVIGVDTTRVRGVHRVVWETIHGGPLSRSVDVCHHCDNPPCCNPGHLFAGTRQDNVDDMMAKGRYCKREYLRGEDHPLARLTKSQVLEVMRLRGDGWTQMRLAGHFGVSRMVIRGVIEGKTWRHVTQDAVDQIRELTR